jgi:hypothetical protein
VCGHRWAGVTGRQESVCGHRGKKVTGGRRKVGGHRGDGVTGGRRKLCNEQLRVLFCSSFTIT